VEKQTGQVCAVQVDAGAGGAVVIACDVPCDLDFWRAALGAVGVRPRVRHDVEQPGLVATTTRDRSGQRLLHLLNVGPVAVAGSVSVDGDPYLGGRTVRVPARAGLVLPLRVDLVGARLVGSTAEVHHLAPDHLVLHPTQDLGDVVRIETDRPVTASRGEVVREDGVVTVSVPAGTEPVTLRLG
jgi:beta-galactosidase